jgi:hypothetical protein
MGEATRTSSRRSLLGRGLLVAAGAIGVGAAARGSSSTRAAPQAKGDELRLYGRNLHLHAASHRAGEVPVKGDRHSAYGELLDRPNGKVIGRFDAAHLTQGSPFAAVASSLEIHTFTLPDGTIHGLGLAPRGSEGHFVILGGTGRFAGVQGTYVATQRQRELGGDGTAEFHLTLAA